MRIAVLGAGAWGTALAQHIAVLGDADGAPRSQVRLWARDSALLDAIARDRCNPRYLPGIALAPALAVQSHLPALLDWLVETAALPPLLVCATSLAGLRPTLTEALRYLRGQRAALPAVVWLCKGIEADTGLLPHQIAAQLLGSHGLRAGPLAGPSFAQEVAAGMPAALTVAATDPTLHATVCQAAHGGPLRIYASDDLLGVELGGALKNVIAIATGVCDGLGLGLNARAALVTRGLAEIGRLGHALGARSETFMGLTGLGDLVLTCTGDLSRNRRVGLELARGQSLADILQRLGHVAEGVACVHAARALGRRHQVELPIVDAVADLLDATTSPAQAVQDLLAREPKRERD